MLVSHRHKFVLFPDPLGSCPWINRALEPWLDQPIASKSGSVSGSSFFQGMSPPEAELAFDLEGYAFRNYARIAIIRNPYAKMVQLYDRISTTDKIWRMRRGLGANQPDFARWLAMTRPNGAGAAPLGGPKWRRFGAWSAENWCGDQISHVVRAEHAEQELRPVFDSLGIAPAIGGRALDAIELRKPVSSRYSVAASDLIMNRYAWDMTFYDSLRADLQLVA